MIPPLAAHHDAEPPPGQALSGPARVITAGVAAATLASTNFVQPLTPVIAGDRHIGLDRLGSVGAATQIGYALGALAIVPLGDVTDRRRLAPPCSRSASPG